MGLFLGLPFHFCAGMSQAPVCIPNRIPMVVLTGFHYYFQLGANYVRKSELPAAKLIG